MADGSNQKFWDRVAKIYTPMMERGNRKFYDELAEALQPWLNLEQELLELACGTGQLTFRLGGAVRSWRATDFSPAMVRESERRSTFSNISFEVADATCLSYEDDRFDVVVIANALHIMPEPEKAMKEIRRVLKPKGTLMAPTFVQEPGKTKPLLKLFELFGFKTFHKWTASEFSEFVTSNGFEVLECRVIATGKVPECLLVAKNR